MLGQQRVDDALGRVPADGRAAARAVDLSDLRVEQAEVVVDLGGGPHDRARRPHRVLLLEGDRGPDVFDPVHVGPVDALEEQAGVGGEGLDVAPLPLGEDRIERERRLAGAGDAGDDGHPVVRDGEGNVLEVVLPRSVDPEP